MENDEARVEIVEKEFVNIKKPIIIEGFPSVGLVGAIATEYIAGELKMKEIGFINSRYLPPVILVKDGEPKAPIRIYAKDNMVVIVSDTAVPASIAHDISEMIVRWALDRNAEKIISVGGIQHSEEEGQSTKIKVYALSPYPKLLRDAKKKGMDRVELGFLTGVMGLLMMECVQHNLPILGLLADAHYGYPDPASAAAVIEALNKLLGTKINTKPLLEASKKIEKRFTALMETTKETMQKPTTAEEAYSMYG